MMHPILLVLQIERDWDLFRAAFTGSESLPLVGSLVLWSWTLSGLGAMLAAWAAWSLIRRDRAELGPANRRVCAALGLGLGDRRLLRRVARSAGLRHVAAMLISEGCFEYAAGHYARTRGARPRLLAIRRRVFGD